MPVPRGHTNLATVSSTRAHGKEPPIAFSELQPPLPFRLQANTDRETACMHARIQQSAHARQAPGEMKSYGAISEDSLGSEPSAEFLDLGVDAVARRTAERLSPLHCRLVVPHASGP